MSDSQQERLASLLRAMQAERSLRKFARDIKISYASLSAYILGDSFPEMRNLEQIAKAKGWSREELEAYLDDRPVESKLAIEDVLREVRQMNPKDALRVAEIALARIRDSLDPLNVER
jgi:transcriptional regulator with XRE-family HTH domain